MDLGVISVRYARALLRCAMSDKQEDVLYREMQSLSDCYLNVPELKSTVVNPMVTKEQKQQVLELACGGSSASATARRFVALVLKEGREEAILFMAAAYITLYRKQKHITSGRFVTATAVKPETELKMKKFVEDRTQGTVEFSSEVDPDIIGGFILEYDTYRMDASVRTHLSRVLQLLNK